MSRTMTPTRITVLPATRNRFTAMPIHKRARMGLSYLPQDASVFRRLSVEHNIRAVLELQRSANGRSLSGAEIQDTPRTATSLVSSVNLP